VSEFKPFLQALKISSTATCWWAFSVKTRCVLLYLLPFPPLWESIRGNGLPFQMPFQG
jgi:hypothetical protein